MYCAVTQHSRNGATFYLENFPSMTGREYRSTDCILPHLFTPTCLLSCLHFGSAVCFAFAFGHWTGCLERCLCTADRAACLTYQHACWTLHRCIVTVHCQIEDVSSHTVNQTGQNIPISTISGLTARRQAIRTLHCCAWCLQQLCEQHRRSAGFHGTAGSHQSSPVALTCIQTRLVRRVSK